MLPRPRAGGRDSIGISPIREARTLRGARDALRESLDLPFLEEIADRGVSRGERFRFVLETLLHLVAEGLALLGRGDAVGSELLAPQLRVLACGRWARDGPADLAVVVPVGATVGESPCVALAQDECLELGRHDAPCVGIALRARLGRLGLADRSK